MQEVRKSQNQDLRADPVWSIYSGKMESNPEDFPGFRSLKAAASSSDILMRAAHSMAYFDFSKLNLA